MSRFYHISSPKIRKMHFWGTSCCCVGMICLPFLTKSNLVVILRGQPSFYDHPFTRYGFCDLFAAPGLFPSYFRLTHYDPKYGTRYLEIKK